MAEIPRSSFIPKQSGSAIPATMRRRKTFGVFNFLASFMLLVSLVLAGGAYFYKEINIKRLDQAKQLVADEEKKFGSEKLNEIRNFNRQLLAVKFLLDRHIAPLKIFNALEFATMQRVQFKDFSLEYDPLMSEALVTMTGDTEEFKTVALQTVQFEGRPLLKDVLVTELGSEEGKSGESDDVAAGNNGKINFTVKGKIPLDLLRYEGKSITEQPSNPSSLNSPD